MIHDRLVQLFERAFGQHPTAVLEVAGDGSQRRYFRLVGPGMETAIGAVGPDHEENRAFLSFSRSFRDAGLPVPRIYGTDEEAGLWLEEDLGDTTLFSLLADARSKEGKRFPESVLEVYERVVEALPRFQVLGGRVVDFTACYPRSAFDRQSMMWDLNYFKYHFLKLARVPFNEARLERDFKALVRYLLRTDTNHFMYRDFQSRNVMIREDGPWFIDYQGGRRGALHYDIASLLYDAKAAIPDEVRAHLLEHYLGALSGHVSVDGDEFRELFRGYVLVRVMQAMGAYGYRGFFERKPRFLQSVPYAAQNLAGILEQGLPVHLPELEGIFQRIVDEWHPHGRRTTDEGVGLQVRIGSFSYKEGYPRDEAGHGGGFVFDCRAIPNPGRHLEYSEKTGRDKDVIAYIERWPESEAFWRNVRELVDAQVQEYARRGFTSLSVHFGCTGGRHRSVYFAERLARHLTGIFPDVRVRLEHREASSWATAPEARTVDDVPSALPPSQNVSPSRSGEPARSST
jgi:aminoglycoside/choline kinase family phosphotransferase